MKTRKEGLKPIYPVTAHTDHVGQGSTFVVIRGQNSDGQKYIPLALEKGAQVIVVEEDHKLSQDVLDAIEKNGAVVERVESARKALASLSAQAAGYPAEKLKFIGVTGTKGKTTSCVMLAHMLNMLGRKTALICTAGVELRVGRESCCGGKERIYTHQPDPVEQYAAPGGCQGGKQKAFVFNNDQALQACEMPEEKIFSSSLTTPQPDFLHYFFKKCVESGVEYVVIEVAAQAHTFSRIDGITFQAALFTNLEQEHGELYASMEEYFAAKIKLFDAVQEDGVFVSHVQDEYGAKIAQKFPSTITYGRDAACEFVYAVEESGWDQQVVSVHHAGKQTTITFSGFPGNHNAANMVGAYVVLKQLGLPVYVFHDSGIAFPEIPGRLEPYMLPNGACALIDYAHTAGSFEQVLGFIRPKTKHLIVVFGAGGGKDKKKRPLMGAVAAKYADVVILTDDNPRFEDPVAILKDIEAGVQTAAQNFEQLKVLVEHDREKAIRKAYELSGQGSLIVLFGKGPDEVQIMGDARLFFSEKDILFSLK